MRPKQFFFREKLRKSAINCEAIRGQQPQNSDNTHLLFGTPNALPFADTSKGG
ncbi:MAG: hypothetical protein ABII93_00750 [Chrysiogenia bacterium]